MPLSTHPFPKAPPLPTLETHAWKLEGPHSLKQDHYFIAETEPNSGRTLALLEITIDPGRFIRLVNTDLATLYSKGFMRLLKHKSKGFGFLNISETKHIQASYKAGQETVHSSGHDFAYTDNGLLLDPIGAPSVDMATDVLSAFECKLLCVDMVKAQASNQKIPLITQLNDHIEGVHTQVYITLSPTYSKTMLVYVDSQLIFVKQTRSLFSKTEINIARGKPNALFHYTRFDHSFGYESVCHYLKGKK